MPAIPLQSGGWASYLQNVFAQYWRPGTGEERSGGPRRATASQPGLIFYIGFLIYAFSKHGGFLFIDLANLVVHEGGHMLFGWFGPTLGLWGGTILQWLVPLLLAAYFFSQRQTTAFAFCSFFFFENWLYTATYMADARAMLLPLVTAGDSDYIEHDWHTIFSNLGVLQYDTKIAAVSESSGLARNAGNSSLAGSQKPQANPGVTRCFHHEPRRDSCPQLSSRAQLDPVFAETKYSGALLRRTAEASCPHVARWCRNLDRPYRGC